MPAPKLPSSRQSGKSKGSADYNPLLYRKVSPEIAAIPKGAKFAPVMSFPDSLMFELSSIVSPEDAITLASRGVKSKDEAMALLDKRGVTGVLVERGEYAEAASRSGISAHAFLTFMMKQPPAGHDPQLFADAASLYHLKAARESDLTVEVLSGNVRLSDIKAVGVTRIAASNDRNSVLSALRAIKNGTVPYDADELKSLLEKPTRHVARSLDLAGMFGTEFVVGLDSVLDTWKTHLHLEKTGYDTSKEKDVLAYGNTLWTEFNAARSIGSGTRSQLRYADIPALHDAGISAEQAAKELNDGFEVNQLIARLKHGVHTSLSDGFL